MDFRASSELIAKQLPQQMSASQRSPRRIRQWLQQPQTVDCIIELYWADRLAELSESIQSHSRNTLFEPELDPGELQQWILHPYNLNEICSMYIFDLIHL